MSDLDSEVNMTKLSCDEVEGVSCSSPSTDSQLAYVRWCIAVIIDVD